jgi:tetratricopeptide (TPR) repeat protein
VGIEVVLGALIDWANDKASRADKVFDGDVDLVVDAGVAEARAKVVDVLPGKLKTDSAVQKLAAEVAVCGEVSRLTQLRVKLAVQAAEADDEHFAAALGAVLADVQSHGATELMAYEHDLASCQELGDQHGEGRAWNNLGLALRTLCQFDEAITAHETARNIYQELRDRHGEGIAWNNLGRTLHEMRRGDAASSAWDEAIAAYNEADDEELAAEVRLTKKSAWPVDR